MTHNILHLTDLHVNDISDKSGEYLRPLFYKQYLQEFCSLLKSKFETIDALVITGDFVHCGNFANFEHVDNIVCYLKEHLGITDREVCVTIGNHDIDRKLDFDDCYDEAREQYNSFSEKFFKDYYANDFPYSERIKYKHVSDDLLFISLDSTWGRIHKKDKPGKIEHHEIESILSTFKAHIENSTYKTIIIGSHYPLDYIECPDVPEESDWYETHFWKSGEHLKRRLNDVIKDIKIIWLSGDIHNPSFVKKDNNLYIVSGRFGTASELFDKANDQHIRVDNISYVNRQATVIQIEANHSANVYVINQYQTTHGFDPNSIKWSLSEINEFTLLQNQPELISDSLDSILKNYIINEKLFDYEKIVVDNLNDEVSLGWVMIDRVFSYKENMNLTCREISTWIKFHFKEIDFDNIILVGLDFWGAIMASNLSIMLGIENICIAGKGSVGTWSHKEHLDGETEKFKIHLKEKKDIIIIADVVASGRSVKNITSALKNIAEVDAAVSCVSLLCDMKQTKKEDLKVLLKFFGTCCGSFRLPIFSKSQLPALELMRAEFSTRDGVV